MNSRHGDGASVDGGNGGRDDQRTKARGVVDRLGQSLDGISGVARVMNGCKFE